MSLALLPQLKFREFDSNGNPLAGGKLYSFIAGTSTPLGTYQDPDGSTPNTNPITLDADGRADVYIQPGSGGYKFVCTDANDVVQYTVDDINVSPSEAVSGWTEHVLTDGQAATVLTGETVDFDDYSSEIYDVEIIRGTTVIANGLVAVQNLNGTGRVSMGLFLCSEAHGVTFTVSQAGMVATLRAAASSGPGNGTIKLSRRRVPA